MTDDHNVTAALIRIEGRLDTLNADMTASVRLITEQMQAGDERGKQLIELLRQAMAFHAADLGKLDAIVRENNLRVEDGLSTVRVDVESQISANRRRLTVLEDGMVEVRKHVDMLRLSWAKVTGLAAAAGVLTSATTAFLLKAVGT